MGSLRVRVAVLHRLAQRYDVYPLTASTLVAMILLAARSALTGIDGYAFLGMNLFLAIIPYAASLWAEAEHAAHVDRIGRLFLPMAIWLLFLPNAPYIVTDLVHLNRCFPPVPLWYDAVLIFAFAGTGCLFGMVSLRIMQARVRALAGRTAAWVFVIAAIALCGPGIYMGRVLRWNSWHVFTQPGKLIGTVLAALTNPLSHWPAFAASGVFSLFVLGAYATFLWLRTRETEERHTVET